MFQSNRGVAKALLSIAAFSLAAPAVARPTGWVVRPEWVKAHEDFLASPALQGRGSATRDEAIAAEYVAAQFERLGLKMAPGMTAYTQVARLIRPRLSGSPTLTLGGSPLNSLTFLFGADYASSGYAVMRSADPNDMPASDVVVVTDPAMPLRAVMAAAEAKHVRLVILPASETTKQVLA